MPPKRKTVEETEHVPVTGDYVEYTSVCFEDTEVAKSFLGRDWHRAKGLGKVIRHEKGDDGTTILRIQSILPISLLEFKTTSSARSLRFVEKEEGQSRLNNAVPPFKRAAIDVSGQSTQKSPATGAMSARVSASQPTASVPAPLPAPDLPPIGIPSPGVPAPKLPPASTTVNKPVAVKKAAQNGTKKQKVAKGSEVVQPPIPPIPKGRVMSKKGKATKVAPSANANKPPATFVPRHLLLSIKKDNVVEIIGRQNVTSPYPRVRCRHCNKLASTVCACDKVRGVCRKCYDRHCSEKDSDVKFLDGPSSSELRDIVTDRGTLIVMGQVVVPSSQHRLLSIRQDQVTEIINRESVSTRYPRVRCTYCHKLTSFVCECNRERGVCRRCYEVHRSAGNPEEQLLDLAGAKSSTNKKEKSGNGKKAAAATPIPDVPNATPHRLLSIKKDKVTEITKRYKPTSKYPRVRCDYCNLLSSTVCACNKEHGVCRKCYERHRSETEVTESSDVLRRRTGGLKKKA